MQSVPSQQVLKPFQNIQTLAPTVRDFFQKLRELRNTLRMDHTVSHMAEEICLWVALDFGNAIKEGKSANFNKRMDLIRSQITI